MQFTQKTLIALLLLTSANVLVGMEDSDDQSLLVNFNDKGKAEGLRDSIFKAKNSSNDFRFIPWQLDSEKDEIRSGNDFDENYNKNLISALNKLKLTRMRNSLIVENFKEVELAVINKPRNEVESPVINKHVEEAQKTNPFYKKYPKITFGLGALSGGLLFGTLAHYGYNPISWILGARK